MTRLKLSCLNHWWEHPFRDLLRDWSTLDDSDAEDSDRVPQVVRR